MASTALELNRSQEVTPTISGSTPARHVKVLYRIPEAMTLLSMSRTVIYDEMRGGRLRYVMQGSDRRIPAKAIDEYEALLEAEALRGHNK
ncbi:helix-turn-helix domain-containing protein [Catelliglobosispora koreensis]|uniref:helix-turn-helix domain-containing protein n=1 Tax=Catelliglobosispora koreensis TaxID=129052 RepID=UPI0003796FE1